MSHSVFYKYFLIISVATAILLVTLCQFSLFKPYLFFSFISLALFMILTVGMFLMGDKTARSTNKGLFTGVILFSTFGKIFLSLLVVVLYFEFGHPPSKIFLLPFFIVYLIFTVFETYLMMQIGQHTKPVS